MATPMQQQFTEVKRSYPDAIVLFRLGDFYETFDDDAKHAAKVLGITLTGRGQGANRRPMAGIPHHALNNYLPKLVAAGCKVVIVDQTSEPQPGKLVERAVTDIITPGAIIDENLLTGNQNNFLASVYLFKDKQHDRAATLLVDVGTNDVYAYELGELAQDLAQLKELLARYQVKEIVVNEQGWQRKKEFFTKSHFPSVELFNTTPDIDFDLTEASSLLAEKWGYNSLQAWGISKKSPIIGCINSLYKYLRDYLKKELTLERLQLINPQETVHLAWNTLKSLEVFEDSQRGDNSLVSHLDQTLTAAGRRKLYSWLLNPLLDREQLTYRLVSVELLKTKLAVTDLAEAVTALLAAQPDYDRFWTKANYDRLKPHDLWRWGQGVLAVTNWQQSQAKSDSSNLFTNIWDKLARFNLTELAKVAAEFDRALNPGLSNLSEPGFIKPEYDQELAALVEEAASGHSLLQKLQAAEIARTGINNLKVKYNKVFGYYIEVSNANLDKVPAHYVRKQTLVNAERFITDELKKWEERALSIHEIRLRKEQAIFADLLSRLPQVKAISQDLGQLLSELDCLVSLAKVALKYNYVKPEFNVESAEVEVKGLRHPVLAAQLEAKFVVNDLQFSASECFKLITGPNMAGKSTYIRSVGILQLLAQIGSFVPAESARLNLVDGIFTRVGASDNLSQNESTFMVEMIEMGYILKHASSKSLIILDEVGRGTSTYDGVSLAWALVEHLSQKIKAFTLFATHYHELTELAKTLSGVKNFYVEVIPREKLFFTHKVKPGALNKSFGVAVAKMAGIDSEIINRAAEILMVLEKENDVKRIAKLDLNYNQPGLLSPLTITEQTQQLTAETEQRLAEFAKLLELDLGKLTPLELMNKLAQLQERYRNE